MQVKDIPEIDNLSIEEKILLVEDLWESISSTEADVPIPQSNKDELDRRWTKFKANPGKLLTIEELQANIKSKIV